MDICSHIGLSVTNNVKDLHGLCMNTLESTPGVRKVLSVDELGIGVSEFLNIQDDREEDSSSSPPHRIRESHPSKISTRALEKNLIKCATFPCSDKTLSSHSDDITSEVLPHHDNAKSLDPSGLHSTSLHTHLKPVSAIKGSREKRGAAPPVKLTVKWAPDVYDPIPTSVSHIVSNNRSSKHNKRSSRNKQKNASKSSRGSKGKDKKQVRKHGGNSSTTVYKSPKHEDEVVGFHEHECQPDATDFHVGNPDRFCGSSFLKGYGTSLHLSSVAEAT